MASDRIDGWKAVGQYLGRERTTVIRWARTRNLPVHRMPGGQKATIYAFKHELDQWIRSSGDEPDDAIVDETGAEPAPGPAPESGDQPVPSPRIAPPPRRYRMMLVSACLALVLASGLLVAARWWPAAEASRAAATALPADPVSARLYLQARDDWARRTPGSLDRAIAALEQVTRREPDFALAYAGLADAFLLAREFGAMRDAEAFSRAGIAADKALKLDPAQASAHRARGFILYWWGRDPRAAGEAFRRAIALAPASAQSHFWYGNILSDNGEHAAALRELDAARLIEPGSVAIQSDFGYALWASGRTREGTAHLERLAAAQPGFAGLHDCLADLRLARGDYAGYVREYAAMVRLRGDRHRAADAAMLERALAQGGPAVHSVLLEAALRDIARNERIDHAWPAFVASVARDREQLLEILATAGLRKEEWGSAALTSQIAAAWAGDAEVLGRLRARAAPRVEG